MPGVRLMSQKNRHTARFTPNARIEILMDAFAPKRLQIMSMQRKETQLTAKPQSSASHGVLKSSLFAMRFMRITLTMKIVTVGAGMLRSKTL